jgi:hypothetical protein
MKPLRKSKWQFNTSNGAGLSVGVVGAEGWRKLWAAGRHWSD